MPMLQPTPRSNGRGRWSHDHDPHHDLDHALAHYPLHETRRHAQLYVQSLLHEEWDAEALCDGDSNEGTSGSARVAMHPMTREMTRCGHCSR